jgi:hypothetical protein
MIFQFDGVDYRIVYPGDAMSTGVVQLPDGRQLRIENWVDTTPIKVGSVSLTANHEKFATTEHV